MAVEPNAAFDSQLPDTDQNACQEHFVAFLDLLGFRDKVEGADGDAQQQMLNLLRKLASLRQGDELRYEPPKIFIKPAITTFSDSVIISYQLDKMRIESGFDEGKVANLILFNFKLLLTRITSAALSFGFLVRGGVAVGNLYHAENIVFGKAFLEAYSIESKIAIYPRVVISKNLVSLEVWKNSFPNNVFKDTDGRYRFDNFSMLSNMELGPRADWTRQTGEWCLKAIETVQENIKEYEGKDLKVLAKWKWFEYYFREGLACSGNAFDAKSHPKIKQFISERRPSPEWLYPPQPMPTTD